jgi:two-component system sensor histidine kinase DegS
MIQNLSPPELEQATLDQTLRWLVDLFKSRYGFQVAYRTTGSPNIQRDQLRLAYRCIRELLMNACKHSQCKTATVVVDITADAIDILVMDEGVGFDSSKPITVSQRRFGLDQLRARVHTVGGELNIDAALGKGTRVIVKLPTASSVPA